MPDGRFGDCVFPKNVAVRGPPKSRFGPRVLRTVKIGISEEKRGNQKKGKKSQIAHPMGQELSFVETHTWISARDSRARFQSDGVLPLWK